jgi:site-specific DNA recombinase
MDESRQAAIYCRISEDRTGAGLGIERQEAECRALAERLGWEIVAVHADNDISAHSGRRRPGYEALLLDLRTGVADSVLAWHTDRLHRRTGRGPGELEVYIDLCHERGIPTKTVTAGELDLSTASGRMTARIHAAVARAEIEHQIERQKAARFQAVANGRWTGGRRPFGYEADGVTVNRAEAEALRWAASQVLAGVSLNATVTKLNDRGVRTATGKEWQPTELRRVLVRPRNAGLIVHRGEIVGRAEWPAILDEDTWREVCAVIGDPTRRTNKTTARQWLLSGLARCGAPAGDAICGSLVRSFSAGGRSRGRPLKPTYTCRTGKHVVRDAAELDAFIEKLILERLSRPDAADLLAPDQRVDTTALHLRDAALRARLDELGRLYGEDMIDAAQLAEGTAAIRRHREEITAQLAAASRGSVLAGVADAADPAKVWAGLDLSRRRAIVDVLVDVVILPAAHKGRRAGWRAGETYFDPASVQITWKRGGELRA